MEPSSGPKEITFRFEKLLAALVAGGVDFAAAGGLAIRKDKLDVAAKAQETSR